MCVEEVWGLLLQSHSVINSAGEIQSPLSHTITQYLSHTHPHKANTKHTQAKYTSRLCGISDLGLTVSSGACSDGLLTCWQPDWDDLSPSFSSGMWTRWNRYEPRHWAITHLKHNLHRALAYFDHFDHNPNWWEDISAMIWIRSLYKTWDDYCTCRGQCRMSEEKGWKNLKGTSSHFLACRAEYTYSSLEGHPTGQFICFIARSRTLDDISSFFFL